MRVRIAEAFRSLGHDAISCDLLESEMPGPPCTYLCVSGACWIKERNLYAEQKNALEFVSFRKSHWSYFNKNTQT